MISACVPVTGAQSACSLTRRRVHSAGRIDFAARLLLSPPSPPSSMSGAPKCGKCSKTVYDQSVQQSRIGLEWGAHESGESSRLSTTRRHAARAHSSGPHSTPPRLFVRFFPCRREKQVRSSSSSQSLRPNENEPPGERANHGMEEHPCGGVERVGGCNVSHMVGRRMGVHCSWLTRLVDPLARQLCWSRGLHSLAAIRSFQ